MPNSTAAVCVAAVHTFGKGLGIAAPQIGIDRLAAAVRIPDDETITPLNAKIIEQSGEGDEQYEGCLSFFKVPCMVPRARRIEVEHQEIDGTRRITRFEDGLARLTAHGIDHLYGVLCRDRMRPSVRRSPSAKTAEPAIDGTTNSLRPHSCEPLPQSLGGLAADIRSWRDVAGLALAP